jgi:hypothetical protein
MASPPNQISRRFTKVRFQVLTAANLMFRIVFWDVIILHGSISQKTILNIYQGVQKLLVWAHTDRQTGYFISLLLILESRLKRQAGLLIRC